MAGQKLGINEESFVLDLKNLKVYKRKAGNLIYRIH
jgi:hypothetical protein